MKKILMIAILALMAISTTCFARNFETPNPDRWVQVFELDGGALWIDRETLRLDKVNKKHSEHYKHRMVTVWRLYYLKAKNSSLKSLDIFDLDCRTVHQTSVFVEDHNTGQIGETDYSYKAPKPIIPDSADEALLFIFDNLWQEKEKEEKKK